MQINDGTMTKGGSAYQQRAKLGSAFLGRLVQWCEAPLIHGVHACVMLNEQGGYIHMLKGK